MHSPPPPERRLSNGLEQFFHALRDRQGLRVLDLSGGSQANIQYIAEQGHKPTQDGMLHALDECFGGAEFFANQVDAGRIAQFCSMTLDHPTGTFQGILGWDSLQYLVAPLLEDVVAQLHRLTEPGGLLLFYFHADERVTELPSVTYHVADPKHVTVAPRNRTRPAKFLSNRQIEQLFSGFTAIKFFVTRDHLREVIVRR